ncbi:MAG: UDP-3-O-(3-hydroxymyristoyl)glucosamine N-acyltransferase [Thiobacillaceae bacterium]|nr:UDP-3-O-(3-hydroxymyristoyl)glucosamine N-acyltransferase [Thiobacillaceae bacterium]MDW8322797.1 UDP-3-O-(3-hydroxymyristoyl)glucosamine N-acyltransferase [Burkholderiales bacterium]
MSGLTLAELRDHLGGEIQGDPQRRVVRAASLASAGADALSFVVDARHLDAALQSDAGVLIVAKALAARLPGRDALLSERPLVAFARALSLLHPESPPPPGVHPTAVVDATAELGEDVSIGAGSVIGAHVRIGARTRIGAQCVLERGARIGTDCWLHARVTVCHDCVIGDRVILHPGCVIGADGFGNAWDDSRWVKIPQIGRVVIGNDVEIGANTTVDRGALDDTVIEDGVRIDNLVQIAHNCVVGAHTAIAGCAGIAGSTRIGRQCLIGGAAMILGHIDIGDRVTVSAASFIGKSLSRPGVYTSAMPQMPHEEWLRNMAQIRHLAEMRTRIRTLERELGALRARIDSQPPPSPDS